MKQNMQKGLKISSPKQILQGLPIALVQDIALYSV